MELDKDDDEDEDEEKSENEDKDEKSGDEQRYELHAVFAVLIF